MFGQFMFEGLPVDKDFAYVLTTFCRVLSAFQV